MSQSRGELQQTNQKQKKTNPATLCHHRHLGPGPAPIPSTPKSPRGGFSPTHRMVISKIWLSLLCSSVACNTRGGGVSAAAPPRDCSPGRINTPPAFPGEGGGWLGKIQSLIATFHLSQGHKLPRLWGFRCGDSPGRRSERRSPRRGLSGISPPLGASAPAPAPPRRRCLLKQRGDGSQVLPKPRRIWAALKKLRMGLRGHPGGREMELPGHPTTWGQRCCGRALWVRGARTQRGDSTQKPSPKHTSLLLFLTYLWPSSASHT